MAVRKPPNPWSEKQVEIGIAVVLLAGGIWFRLPGVGAYLAVAVFARFGWPKPEEIYDIEGPGFTNAGKAQLYATHLMQPLGAKTWFGAVGPDGHSWWPPTRISAWWALLAGLTVGLAELLVMAATGIAMPYFAIDTLAVFLLAQALAAGSRDAAYADFQMQGTFPAAVIDADVVGRLGTTKIIWAPLATAIAIALIGTIATIRVASGVEGFGLPLPIVATGWAAIGLLTGASIGARRYIIEFAAPQREFLTNAQMWGERWLSVRLGQVPPPQYAGEFTQPPEGNGEETHKMAIFQVPAGGTIAKYKDKTEELMSAVATEPGTGKYVLVAPMPDTDPAGQPVPGSRNEQQFKVVWNTVPLPAAPHLAGDLDNWTLAYAIHQAFDRAFNALKLGMPDLVRPIPLVRTPDRSLFETIWNLPQGTTYEKVMKQAEGIAEKIDAPWLRIGRRTHDSDGRVLPDTAISICFGHHPDTVDVDPRTRAFLEALDLHAAFYALKLGAPVLEEAVRLTKPGRPAITEAKFRLSASIDWAAVSKKTAALAEKIEVDYLRITRRDDPSGNPSPLVSVIYGCHPSDTVMLGDPPGYDPDEPLVGPETNSDRLFLDALDWDDYFRACGLVGSDRRSPTVISKHVNKQGVASYECRTVPGLPISDLIDGVEALKATSGLGYVEIESHPKDAALFKLLAAKIDPLDRPYLAVDYANGPKPNTNTTVLHAPVPGVPDIDWAVGPGAEGDLLIDKWEGDNPHLFIGGASGSGKALALDTLIPTPDGERKFGDLRPGDRVFNETGRPCRVVGLSPTWVDRPTFEVEFDDGTVIVADAEHEWVVDDTASRANAARAEHRAQVTDDDWGPTAADAIRAMKSSDGRLVTLADFIDEVGHAGAVRAAVKEAGIEATPLTRKVRYRLTFRSRTVPGYDRDALLDIWADRVERSSNAYARPQKRNASKRIVTTVQMAARVLDRNGKRIWSIDVADPLELPDADLPVDPYLLGILLGDGGLTNPAAPDFTTADPEIVDYVRAALPEDATLSQATECRWNIVREGARPDSAVTQWLRAIGLTAEGGIAPSADPASVLAGAYEASAHGGGTIMCRPEVTDALVDIAADAGIGARRTGTIPFHGGHRDLIGLAHVPDHTDEDARLAGVLLVGLRTTEDGCHHIDAKAARLLSDRLPQGITITPERDGSPRGWLTCDTPKPSMSLIAALNDLGLAGHDSASKFVPEAYLWASAEQRLELLRGLMDTDGSGSEQGSVEYCSTSPRLAEAVLHLARSLGMKASLAQGRSTLNGVDHGTRYRVTWTSTTQVFRLPRKAVLIPTSTDPRVRRRYVTDIRRIDSVPTRCIEVDSPSHQFLASPAMVPTHNSITTLWMLLQLMHNNDPADVKFALADPKTELVYFEDAAHVNHFLGLTTPGFMANPYGAMADLLEHLKEETYRRNQSFTMHPAKPQKLTQARFIARQEIAHAHAGTVPDYWPAATAFPWWDGPPEAHPFMLPYQFIIIEECSTFFKKPANKEQHGDWERLIGHVEEMARIARSAGMHIAAMTQYPKKENIPTTLLAQCRRIGLSMNRIGSMLTIEESGLQDIKTPGRGKMSYGKSYKGVRCLFVRAPDEKDPDAPNDRDMFFEPVPKDGESRVEVGGRLPGTTGPTVVAAAPPDPSGVWLPTGGRSVMPGAVAPSAAPTPVRPAATAAAGAEVGQGGEVPDWDRPDEEYPDLDDLLADLG